MRQIHVCAWLWMTALAATACSGGQFSTRDKESDAGAGDLSEGPSLNDKGSTGGSRSLSVGGNVAGGPAGVGGASVGGAASLGGATNVSGASSSGGTMAAPPASGGAAAEDCASGSVTIRMLPSPKLPKDYLCDASCGTGWLTITDAEGATAFSISAACGTASCDTCEVQTCGAAACLPTALGAAGSELEWTGTYLAKDTCGDHMACQRQACVKPGKYKARACAPLNLGDSEYGCKSEQQQICAEAEFEFPAKEQVLLVLEP